MNGNELNNMAQRYKDEMMRLYKKAELPTMQSARLAVRASPLLRNVSRHRHSKSPIYADFPGSEQLSGITFSALSLFSKRYKGYVGNSRAECT